MAVTLKKAFFSIVYWVLVKKNSWQSKWLLKNFWQFFWDFSIKNYKGTIHFKLHKEWVRMNNGYPYPLFINTFYKYNHPLMEIVYQTYKAKGRSIDYIDVGAAIGDTMLLLFHKCPGMINQFYCFDGDKEFFEYQKYNLRNHTNGQIFNVLLSDENNIEEKNLVRTHLGTASVLGNSTTKTTTLDEVLFDSKLANNIDLIKIDVDGFDGKVIAGAEQIILKYKPVIIFEWHPLIWKRVGTSIYQPFHFLKAMDYHYFVFFDKLGNFSHIQYDITDHEIDILCELCLRNVYEKDWHYDVIALHETESTNMTELIELTYSYRT